MHLVLKLCYVLLIYCVNVPNQQKLFVASSFPLSSSHGLKKDRIAINVSRRTHLASRGLDPSGSEGADRVLEELAHA